MRALLLASATEHCRTCCVLGNVRGGWRLPRLAKIGIGREHGSFSQQVSPHGPRYGVLSFRSARRRRRDCAALPIKSWTGSSGLPLLPAPAPDPGTSPMLFPVIHNGHFCSPRKLEKSITSNSCSQDIGRTLSRLAALQTASDHAKPTGIMESRKIHRIATNAALRSGMKLASVALLQPRLSLNYKTVTAATMILLNHAAHVDVSTCSKHQN